MNKCSPVEMRKNLEAVDNYKRHGIDFVAVPVRNLEHKNELIKMSLRILESESLEAKES